MSYSVIYSSKNLSDNKHYYYYERRTDNGKQKGKKSFSFLLTADYGASLLSVAGAGDFFLETTVAFSTHIACVLLYLSCEFNNT